MKLQLVLGGLWIACLVGCGESPGPAADDSTTDVSSTDAPDPPHNRPPDVPQITEKRPLDELTDDELFNCLGHEDLSKRLEAAERIHERGAELIPKLVEALDNENVHIRAVAVYTLGLFKTEAKSAVPRLKELQEQDDRRLVTDAILFNLPQIEGTEEF